MRNSTRRVRRTRAVLCSSVLVLGVAAAACGPVATAPPAGCPSAPPDAFASTVVNRVNADRGARGLGAVGWNGRLACLANDASRRMASAGQLVHTNLGAVIGSPGYESFASLSENLVYGPGSLSGDSAHDIWMASSHHRANILGSFDAIGVAWARGADGSFWAAEEFARNG